MKFAFLVHPLSEESKALLAMNDDGTLSNNWGGDLLGFCNYLHETMARQRVAAANPDIPTVRVIDYLNNLRTPAGQTAEGRLYEIPMAAAEILDAPSRAIEYIEQAVDMAVEWGAQIVGLGSMTGIVGGGGTYIAQQSPVPVTTGNSLTVYAALQNLRHACVEANLILSRQVVAIIGIPGSIAAAAASMLASECSELLLVGRSESPKSRQLAKSLDAELMLDIPAALQRAGVIFSATSSGNCIDERLLRPGSVVVDVGVPADVMRSNPRRSDVLVISGGLSLVPDSFPRDSMFLGFHQGMVPSCLGETINLALESRAESFSLGRNLSVASVHEIGQIAIKNGFRFDRLYSFGLALGPSQLAEYLKAMAKRPVTHSKRKESKGLPAYGVTGNGQHSTNGSGFDQPRTTATDRCAASTAAVETLGLRAAALHERYINPVLMAIGNGNGFVKTFVRAEQNSLWDDAGNQYIDFVAGFGAANLGHNHPRIVEALTDAMRGQTPGFAQSAVNPLAAKLAEELVAVAPSGLEMVFFSNSGTEAVEAALKLARLATGRTGLLHCDRSFHGKTLGALSVTGNPRYQKPFAPLVPDCSSVPFADLDALERELRSRKYAGFIVEPIQAEAGIYVPPREYLPEAERLCRRYGTLLIVDEVQTGMGRTGTMFAVDSLGVEPDVMTLAKSLGGGMVPIGATLARRDHWLKAYGAVDRFTLHTSTFGGGSLACAAALATLRVLREENLLERCRERSMRLFSGLRSLVERYRCDPLEEVRGEGLLIGLEFSPLLPSIAAHYRTSDPSGMLPFIMRDLDGLVDTVPTLYAMQTLLNVHGIYAQVARSNPFVLRLQPPLTIEDRQIDQLLAALEVIAPDLANVAALVDSIVSKSTLGIHEGKPASTDESGVAKRSTRATDSSISARS